MFASLYKMLTGQNPAARFVPGAVDFRISTEGADEVTEQLTAASQAASEALERAEKPKFLPKTEALLDCVEMKPLPDRIQFGSVLVSADPRRRTPLLVVGVGVNFIEVQEWADDTGRVRQVMEGTFRRTTKNHGYRLLLTAAEVGDQNFLREHAG